MHATIRDHRLWYERIGDAGTPVVLVMGFGISGRAWQPQVEALARHHRVLIFDNRGIGESETSKTRYDFGDLATDTAALMDHVGFETAHVVGVSMGGMIAQHMGVEHPERVRSLSLIATLPGGSLRHTVPGARALALFARANTSRGEKRFAALRRLLYTKSYLTGARPEEDFGGDTMEVFAVPADTTTRVNQLRAILKHDVTGDLPRVDVPALVVKPKQDILVRPHNSDRIAELLPNAELLALDDAGHGLTHQHAASLNDALLAFFARVDRERGDTDEGGGDAPLTRAAG